MKITVTNEKEPFGLTVEAGTYSPTYETLSGSIVTFSDAWVGSKIYPNASIVPVQSLNGQASPYPPGGGKNKFDISAIVPFNANVVVTKTDTSFTVKNNNTYAVGIFRDANGDIIFPVTDGQWTISMASAISVNLPVYATTDGTTYSWFNNGISAGNTSATFTISGQTAIKFPVTCPASGGEMTISRFQVEKSPTATSYAPYSNICPITGYSSVDVSRCGINVWDEEWEVVSNVVSSKNYIPVVPGKQYYWKSPTNPANGFSFYDLNKVLISTVYSFSQSGNVITIPDHCYFVKFAMGASSYGTTYNNDISINYPSTDHDYHPYNGITKTISLGSTIYGGTLDVTTGVLTVEREIYQFTGSENVSSSTVGGHQRFQSTVLSDNAKYSDTQPQMNSHFVATFAPIGTNNVDNAMSCYTNKTLYWRADGYADTTAMKTYFSQQYANGTPVTHVCYLATPTTIQLTGEEITALLGENNVWANSGDVEVTYRKGGM